MARSMETRAFFLFHQSQRSGLAEAVRRAEKKSSQPRMEGRFARPTGESTFLQSKLDHHLRDQQPHSVLWDFYQELFVFAKRCGRYAT